MNRIVLSITESILKILAVNTIIFFYGCSPSTLICFSGLCPSMKEHLSKITWNPPLLNHNNCTNISGKYKARIYLNDNSFNYLELMRYFPQSKDDLGYIQVKLETPLKIPYHFILNPTARMPNAGINDESQFYEDAYVMINQTENELITSLMNNNLLYRRYTISLDSPMIGCDGEDFIIRIILSPPFGEWGYGWGQAIEIRFRKLPDNSLQVKYKERKYNYDPMSGLSEIDPEKNKEGYIKIFPAYNN